MQWNYLLLKFIKFVVTKSWFKYVHGFDHLQNLHLQKKYFKAFLVAASLINLDSYLKRLVYLATTVSS